MLNLANKILERVCAEIEGPGVMDDVLGMIAAFARCDGVALCISTGIPEIQDLILTRNLNPEAIPELIGERDISAASCRDPIGLKREESPLSSDLADGGRNARNWATFDSGDCLIIHRCEARYRAHIALQYAAKETLPAEIADETFDAVIDILAQSYLVAQQLMEKKRQLARSMVMLEAVDQALLLLTPEGKVLMQTANAKDLLDASPALCVRDGYLRAQSKRDKSLISTLLAGASEPSPQRAVTSRFVLRSETPGADLALSTVTLPQARFEQESPKTLICLKLHAIRPRAVVDWPYVARHYHFTEAELRLCRALVSGARIADFCSEKGVSVNTARTQLKSLLAKTSTHKQSELIRLILSESKYY